jgi:hypothetical protein
VFTVGNAAAGRVRAPGRAGPRTEPRLDELVAEELEQHLRARGVGARAMRRGVCVRATGGARLRGELGVALVDLGSGRVA